jgi:hypothetical protein
MTTESGHPEKPPRVGLCLAALALAIGLCALPAAAFAADRFVPTGDGWETYINGRFGTSFVFPADVFTPADPPANGDGRRFLSPDATLELYAWENVDSETAASLEARLVGSEGYEEVTYSPSGGSWLVISGYRGDDIFYEKYFFRGDTIHGFGIEFPAEAKPTYAPIIERIEDSFRAN